MEQIKVLLEKFKDFPPLYTEKEKPFNVFFAASDLYYRENFHSDVIAYILNSNESFLSCFFDYLNTNSEKKKIVASDYSNSIIIREEDRIDILIRDETSKHCIIIENKIYNAEDTERQIPKYVEIKRNAGYEIDAILYYSIDGQKRPEQKTWTKKDKENISYENLIYGAAVKNKNDNTIKTDFVNGFLSECLKLNCNIQEFTFLKQYYDLLMYLKENNMDTVAMEKFYQEILNENAFETAEKIKIMFENLQQYRMDKIQIKYKNFPKQPFERIDKYLSYGSYDSVFQWISSLTDEHIKLDVICDKDKTTLWFWIQAPNTKEDLILKYLKEMNFDLEFDLCEDVDKNSYKKEFAFPKEESQFEEFLEKFIRALYKLAESRR